LIDENSHTLLLTILITQRALKLKLHTIGRGRQTLQGHSAPLCLCLVWYIKL